MRAKEKRGYDTLDIFERESSFLDKVNEIAQNLAVPGDKLAVQYLELAKEYGKLLKQSVKMTHIGDSNQRKLFQAKEQIEKQKQELSIAYEKLEQIARTDPLTGLSNRRDFLERFENERNRFERNGRPFSIVLCDIDHFKVFNDRYGHDCGDFVLVAISGILRKTVRKQDVVGRWGGEEFILLLPESPLEGGKVVADVIREKVAEGIHSFNNQELSVTMTLGVSEFSSTDNIDTCVKRADEALYKGKESGRNRVVTGV